MNDRREPKTLHLGADRTAITIRVGEGADLGIAVRALRIAPCPVVAVVGGAGNLDAGQDRALRAAFGEALVPVIRAHGAAAVDGGTDSGVMRLLGRSRTEAGATFPLIGVAAEGTIRLPGEHNGFADAYPLEGGHSHFVLVPGGMWGDEAPWLARVATAVAAGSPSVTVLINGGEVTFKDARHSIDEGRPVLVLGGTGRTADLIAAASDGGAGPDPRAAELAASPLVRVVAADQPGQIRAALGDLLTR